MMSNLDAALLIVEELTRLGVSQFVISPGSRSTPLTVAVARHAKTETTVHYDERGAAFFALGYGRATGTPAVLVCTSGTAVANYFPAVVEASMDNVPLIVLSADRPPELIGVGANQAILQQDIYGVYPRLAVNLDPPDSHTLAAPILHQVDALYDASMGSHPGPVHMNCQFREPLLPENSHSKRQADVVDGWQANSRYSESSSKTLPDQAERIRDVVHHFADSKRGLIIVGRSVDQKYNPVILELAEKLNLPILPDIQSQLRFTEHAQLINYFDLALLREDLQQSRPDFILHFGGAFTSKRLLKYVNGPDIYYVSVKETPERIDPNHQVSIDIQSKIDAFCLIMGKSDHGQEPGWQHSWKRIDQQTALTVSSLLKSQSQLSEPAISFQVSQLLHDQHALMLANSMSIREMEMFASPGHFHGNIFGNRGSSGIDGLLATSAGFATGSCTPVTVLIGDLALLHDLNSLQLIKASEQPIIIIVVNNDGGGIFSFLPIEQEADVFESFFGTPHGLTLKHAAAMFDLSYSKPVDMDEFQAAYTSAVQLNESCLIELVTDRSENHRFHQHLFKKLRESS